MPLTPWKTLWETNFPTLRAEMDKVFEDFFGRTGFPSLKEGAFVPPVDVRETKKDVIVMLDIPAMDPNDLSVTITEDRLTVKGERKAETEVREEDFFRKERVQGTFQRTVQLPTEVIGDKAKATYKNGVLEITVPKSQKTMPKEVKIEVK
ncbi:MAG TPA: Hsp20/alpha crystallin family protein [Syntrophorhabdaceae bacterium]|nr:Hsp20/alpha crystallin family protein [Syntrophorhabdaceae bacterium]